jgi:hypothetical protein
MDDVKYAVVVLVIEETDYSYTQASDAAVDMGDLGSGLSYEDARSLVASVMQAARS